MPKVLMADKMFQPGREVFKARGVDVDCQNHGACQRRADEHYRLTMTSRRRSSTRRMRKSLVQAPILKSLSGRIGVDYIEH